MEESTIVDELVLWLIETYDVGEVSVDRNDAEGIVLGVSIATRPAGTGDPLPSPILHLRGPDSVRAKAEPRSHLRAVAHPRPGGRRR
jgi:hypothetical protein